MAKEGETTVTINRRSASMVELAELPVRSVSDIEYMAAVFEQVSRDLLTTAEGFIANARRSTEAPVDPGVLSRLRGVVSGAEQAHAAALMFASAFDEYYRDDIAEARRRERMNNEALTG